jgi:hypothetical protein
MDLVLIWLSNYVQLLLDPTMGYSSLSNPNGPFVSSINMGKCLGSRTDVQAIVDAAKYGRVW